MSKRRPPKRRLDARDDATNWDLLFQSSYDFLNLLGFKSDAEARLAARAAWARFGRAYMEQWEPNSYRELPWAFLEFGDPR